MALTVMHGPKFLLRVVGMCTELIPTMELLDLSSSPVFSFTHTARLLDPAPDAEIDHPVGDFRFWCLMEKTFIRSV